MDVFQALSDPTRREIVDLLSKRERTVGELCGRFEISQPAVSRHLRILREGGLVASRSEGQSRVYTLLPEQLREIDRWLERHRQFWEKRLDALDVVLGGAGDSKKKKRSKKGRR